MLLKAWTALVDHHYRLPTGADAVHHVRCADGVVVAVKEFKAKKEKKEKHQLPIVCVPGLGADSTNFDVPAPYGLARVFADAGHDVFVVDLRGTGLSKLEWSRWVSVCFDDFVGLDLPAVFEHVCAHTGAPKVIVVGHSMGGIAAYALLAMGAARIHSVMALAAPLGFPTRFEAAPWLQLLLPLSPFTPGFFGGSLNRLVTPFSMRVQIPFLKSWLSIDRIDQKLMRRVAHHAVQDVPRGLMHQFQDWIENDVIRSKDKTVDYRARVNGCRTPVLVVEPEVDALAHPSAVRRALSLLPNAEHLVLPGYGHVDMVFGKGAPKDVHPHLLAWLARQARSHLRVA